MNNIWIYILLGFMGGFIFAFLIMVGFIKKIIKVGMKKDE